MPTNRELTDMLKEAKKALRAAKEEIDALKSNEVDESTLPKIAVGLVATSDRRYRRVEVAFNPETGQAKVKQIVPAAKNDQSFALARKETQKFLVMDIFPKINS